jgi:hypothetical protein
MPARLDSFTQFITYGRDPRAETLRRIVGPMFSIGGNPMTPEYAIAKPGNDALIAILKALGLDRVRGFNIDAPWGGVVTVTSEQIVTQSALMGVADEIVKRRWRLIEIDDQGRDVVQRWSVPPAPQSRPAETRQSTRAVQGETAAELERDAMPSEGTETQPQTQPRGGRPPLLTKRDEFYLGLLALHARSIGMDIAADAIDDIIKRLGVRTT